MKTPLPEPAMTKQIICTNACKKEILDVAHYTKAQMIEYGKAEFERALLLAMNTTRAFGKTGDVIAVIIGNIKREDEK